MGWLITKYLITSGIIVLVSEVAKRSDKLGAFISSLPTVTILVLIWMYLENQSQAKLSHHSFYTFWYVIPTMPMFLIFPYLLKSFSFWMALLISGLITMCSFALCHFILKHFGIHLM